MKHLKNICVLSSCLIIPVLCIVIVHYVEYTTHYDIDEINVVNLNKFEISFNKKELSPSLSCNISGNNLSAIIINTVNNELTITDTKMLLNNNNITKKAFIMEPLQRVLKYANWNITKIIEEWMQIYIENASIINIDKNLLPQYLYCDLYKFKNKYDIIYIADNNDDKFDSNRISVSIHHLSMLLSFYLYDYELFNLSLPEWICDIVLNEWSKISYNNTVLNKVNNKMIKRKKSSFRTGLLRLWYQINNSQALSCSNIIENCLFIGNCIYNDNEHSLPNVKGEQGIILKQNKLFFCGIPKNSITMFKNVLLRISNIYNKSIKWWSQKKNGNQLLQSEYDAHNLCWQPSVCLSQNTFTSIMNDNNWFKAIFIREPLQRVLSGVLDKGHNMNITQVNDIKLLIKYLFKFSLKYDINEINHHVKPQHLFCYIYKWCNKYHHYKFENIDDRKKFLMDLNLWGKVGSYGWPPHNNSILHFSMPQFNNHATHSSQYILTYFNVRYLSILIEFYGMDYKLFNEPFPEWICTIIDNEWYKLYSSNTVVTKVFLTDLLILYSKINKFNVSLQPDCIHKRVYKCLFNDDCF